MALPKFVQAKKTFLKSSITSAEASSIVLNALVDLYGNELAMTDFGSAGYITLNPGGDKEEIIAFTGFTVNDDGSVTLNAGITRGLLGKSPYGAGGTAYDHSAGAIVVVGNNPQIYDAILDYIAEVANQGAADADETTAGLVEEATTAEIDADTGAGSAARLFVNPAKLVLSKYGTRLPSAAEKSFLTNLMSGIVGAVLPYAGSSAPTGWVLADGTEYDIEDYEDLAVVLKGKYGYGSGTTFTAAADNIITANSHGLAEGDIIFVATSAADLPAGLTVNTPYYVKFIDINTFKVSLTNGGAEVDITDAGTGTHTFYTNFLVPDMRSRIPVGVGTGTKVLTFVSRSSDEITIRGAANNDTNENQTGQAVLYTAASGAITGLTHNTTYYLIRVSALVFKLASSRANAVAGTAISLSSDGTGAQTFTITLTARTLADNGGHERHALTTAELAAHTHTHNAVQSSGTAGAGTSGNSSYGAATIDNAGGSGDHTVMNPFLALNYIIKT